MDFIIRLADTNILIHSVYQSVFTLCKEYLVGEDTDPDIEIYSDDDMIHAEYEMIQKIGGSIDSLKSTERLLIQRKISESLLDRDILLMHGAVIAVDNHAYMFTGKSGTGKTTQIRKWLKNIQESFVVNGDKPLVMLKEEGAFACGTPWCGKENMGNNVIAPLQSIVFMKRSDDNRIEPISFQAAFPALLEQTYLPKTAELQRKTLALLMRLKEKISFYRFYFDNYQQDAFKVPYETLTNKAWDIRINER